MNERLRILMKATPFFSALFILVGLALGIVGAFDHNLKVFISSFIIITQAILLMIYTKWISKIWEK